MTMRTPALSAAAAALGLMAGLALHARAPGLSGEPRAHDVAIWITPAGGPAARGIVHPAGLEAPAPRGEAEAVPARARRCAKREPVQPV